MIAEGSAASRKAQGGVHLSATFWDSKSKVPTSMGKRVDEAVFKLFKDPSNPGLSLERILSKRGKKPSNLWSARVNDDLRLIVAKEGAETTILFVGKHDEAYRWAEVRRASTHGGTGEFQLVLVPEVSEAPLEVRESPRRSPVLRLPAKSLFEVGVPEEWIDASPSPP